MRSLILAIHGIPKHPPGSHFPRELRTFAYEDAAEWRQWQAKAIESHVCAAAKHPGAVFSAATSKSTDRLLKRRAIARVYVYVAEAGAVGAEALQNK